jgi:alanyl-tRNA synthetase
MTLRLYRTDAYLKQFEANVVGTIDHNGAPAIILDQTVFYPTAGGQPNDRGTLGGVTVVDVIEHGDEILHVLDQHTRPQGQGWGEGVRVTGEVDWPRRWNHMQQHSGQHVLSQAFVRVANLDTVAVHIGGDENTLDLPTSKLGPGVVAQTEAEANRILAEDVPIAIYEVTDADLARIPLRKAPKVSGRIRIVEIKDYDWSACGGTHVHSTAQIGIIKITRTEKRGNDTRVTFRCGVRALADYGRIAQQTARLMELTSAGRYDLVTAVEKLQAEAVSNRKALQEAMGRLLAYEATAILAEAQLQHVHTIVRVFEGRDVNDVRALAKALTAHAGATALLGIAGDKCQLIFARAKDAPGDMGQLLKHALAQLSSAARGGGSADFAQGGGVPANAATLHALLNSLNS